MSADVWVQVPSTAPIITGSHMRSGFFIVRDLRSHVCINVGGAVAQKECIIQVNHVYMIMVIFILLILYYNLIDVYIFSDERRFEIV